MPDDAELLVEVGVRVRSARVRAGLSQEQLADACGLHRTYVGSVERGERNIGVLNLLAVATALDVDAADLVRDLRRAVPTT